MRSNTMSVVSNVVMGPQADCQAEWNWYVWYVKNVCLKMENKVFSSTASYLYEL